jgi:MFS family permease
MQSSNPVLPGTHQSHYSADTPASEVAPGEIAVGVVIGRASEYFDFFVYGIASVLVFPSVFFPHMPLLQGILWSFAIFSLAFVARPIGTIVSMWIQKRWGRATKLTLALFGLGTCTVGIALLPGYNVLGVYAIGLLALLRLGQGAAVGASWDGLPSLLALNAPENRRGWYAMVGQLGAPVGFMIAAGLFAYIYSSLSFKDFIDWGWRYPFFAAFALNVVALFARLRLVVTNEFERELGEHELEPANVAELMREKGLHVWIGAAAALASYALFHVVTIFPLSWMLLNAEHSVTDFLIIQVMGAFNAAGAIVLSGLIADKLGRRTTLVIFAVATVVFSLVAPWLLDAGTMGQYVFVLLGFVLLGFSYGQAAGSVTANFGAKYRYTGAALTSDLAWLIGAAFAPLIVLGLTAQYGLAVVSLYLISGALCTMLALGINSYRNLQS